jgi:riboflavin transporter FmnP
MSAATVRNTNRWDTKTLVTMALFSAVGVLLSYLEIPVFAPAPYLKFDPSFITAIVGGFLFGPTAGIVIGLVQNIVHGIFSTGGGFFGALMNCAIVIAYVWPASMIYKHRKTFGGALVGLVVGIVCGVVMALLMNIWVTPLYTSGVTTQVVIGMIVPVLLPFNLIKLGIDSVLTLLVYKPISNMVKPTKEHRSKKDVSHVQEDR